MCWNWCLLDLLQLCCVPFGTTAFQPKKCSIVVYRLLLYRIYIVRKTTLAFGHDWQTHQMKKKCPFGWSWCISYNRNYVRITSIWFLSLFFATNKYNASTKSIAAHNEFSFVCDLCFQIEPYVRYKETIDFIVFQFVMYFFSLSLGCLKYFDSTCRSLIK